MYVSLKHLFYFFFSVVKTTVLFADITDFAAVNDLYKQCKPSCYTSGFQTIHSVIFVCNGFS
jgi:enamine deaminase RidA (YjgF/YER057c/UK114 family)